MAFFCDYLRLIFQIHSAECYVDNCRFDPLVLQLLSCKGALKCCKRISVTLETTFDKKDLV